METENNVGKLEDVLLFCGITRDNVFENIFIYSIFAAQSLDFLASAAGRYDIEAARYIRTAQQMVRTRVDILFRTSFFRDENFKAKGSFKPFGNISIATSEDAGNAFKTEPDEIIDDLEKFFRGATANGDFLKMQGIMFENLRMILKAEESFHRCQLEQIVNMPSDDQKFIMQNLQKASVIIQANIYKGIGLLRDKFMVLQGYSDRLVCSSCGSPFKEIEKEKDNPEPCPVCGAPASMIIKNEVKTIDNMDELYGNL